MGRRFLPADDEAWSVLFESLLVSRACDELHVAPGPRSDWLGLPLAGLDELLGERLSTDGPRSTTTVAWRPPTLSAPDACHALSALMYDRATPAHPHRQRPGASRPPCGARGAQSIGANHERSRARRRRAGGRRRRR